MVQIKNKPVVLLILDGWGVAPASHSNAITTAQPANINRLAARFPHTTLSASGESVGLPSQEPGNSEVGHLNLGAGRIVYQELPRINMAIADGSFQQNQAFQEAITHSVKNESCLHLMGLIGAGTVHSSNNHLYALLWLLKQANFPRPVYLHLFTDGRDSPPTSAFIYLKEVVDKIKTLGIGEIATICGRYYAMDRDNRWDRTQKAYQAMVENIGERAGNPLAAVKVALDRGETDEFIKPTIIINSAGNPVSQINNNDAVIFFNFRTDRPRQLVKAFVFPNFEMMTAKKILYDPFKDNYIRLIEEEYLEAQTKTFNRIIKLNNLCFVTMTEYEKGLPVTVAFPQQTVNYPLSAVISSMTLKQLHISETEKYAHVTYFFNGGREDPYPGEDRIHIPSQKVATYDLKPEMSAYEITSVSLQRIDSKMYDFMVINLANADMVGHSGKFDETVKACKTVDDCVGKICNAVLANKGAFIITGDHGKAESMINESTSEINTFHSHNPVPFILGAPQFDNQPRILNIGILGDVGPTILKLMGLPIPGEMTGRVLI